jgi:hypothetical protein
MLHGAMHAQEPPPNLFPVSYGLLTGLATSSFPTCLLPASRTFLFSVNWVLHVPTQSLFLIGWPKEPVEKEHQANENCAPCPFLLPSQPYRTDVLKEEMWRRPRQHQNAQLEQRLLPSNFTMPKLSFTAAT